MQLRPYESADCEALATLFYETVHTVNVRDYSPAQLDAWASGTVDLAEWDKSFLEHISIVAIEGEQIVGFGDMRPDGYLDRLYVHRDHQRQGIATAICDALERAVPAEHFITHASLTARPFFESRGYQAIKKQRVLRSGIALTNFVMEKEDLRCSI